MEVLTSHESDQWFTPPEVIELIVSVIGTINLDVASCALSQTIVRADRYFDLEDNALRQPWKATSLYMNPPYGKSGGKSNQGLWSARVAAEYELNHFERGISLVNTTCGYGWFERMWTRWPVCCLRDRVRFIRPNNPSSPGLRKGESWFDEKLGLIRSNLAKRGQSLVFYGKDVEKFADMLCLFGRVILPEK